MRTEIKHYKPSGGTSSAAQITDKARSLIASAVPEGVKADSIALALRVALANNPNLAACSLSSIFAAVYQIAALGLTPGDSRGLAYLIPYGKTCQLIVGYRGLIQLAVGSGGATSIRAGVVGTADEWEWVEGLEPVIRHKPKSSAPRPADVIAAYAIAELPGGGHSWAVLTRDDLEARRKVGASGKGRASPWDEYYSEMARKSAVRALCKYLILSPDRAAKLARAEAAEAGELDERGTQLLADLGYSVDVEAVEPAEEAAP